MVKNVLKKALFLNFWSIRKRKKRDCFQIFFWIFPHSPPPLFPNNSLDSSLSLAVGQSIASLQNFRNSEKQSRKKHSHRLSSLIIFIFQIAKISHCAAHIKFQINHSLCVFSGCQFLKCKFHFLRNFW